MHGWFLRGVLPSAFLAAGSLGLVACSSGRTPPSWVSPRELCRAAVVPDVSFGPAGVVGSGTPESCSEAALHAAVQRGGSIRFSCGTEPVAIDLTRELLIDKDTLIDGEKLITLTGSQRTRVVRFQGAGPRPATLVLRKLSISDAFSDGVDGAMPVGSSGGAIRQEGGRLFVEDTILLGNRSAPRRAEVSGGAIYNEGGELIIRDSNIIGHLSSNGGALGVRDGSLRIERTWLVSNIAVGVGGVPGDGGVGGGIDMRGSGSLVMCESTLWDDYARTFGGGLFRIGTGDDVTALFGVALQGNFVIPGHAVLSRGGALHLQDTEVAIESSTLYGNAADAGGAAYFGAGTHTLLLNSTFSQNAAERGGGGAILFEERATPLPIAEIQSCTFAVNQVTSLTGGGGAIAGGGLRVKLRNNLFVANRTQTQLNAQTCSRVMDSSGPNLQNDATWFDGSSDVSRAPCAVDVTAGDTHLMQIDFFGGPTKTHYLTVENVAATLGRDCPATDQRGKVRPSQGCTVGAYEVER